jgi:hypothetical protein
METEIDKFVYVNKGVGKAAVSNKFPAAVDWPGMKPG